ncbi:hypothetical protein JJD41_22715 [Oxynema sp. CENA135]|uniref:hypothetical protein n=1 Tax=Oxynema sp. CENA135 TaxID=984206 RepID=UPI00190B002F|nr:hypothetical protein [Oxynema sp. CENA135]MBK4732657.1 hypothetical protein [Oxynema sp. CENA135]
MARPTQAHMSQSWESNRASGFKDMKKRQMEYYMGAKLIEVGVDPKAAIFRWSLEQKNGRETWTYSAYWADSKEELLLKEKEEQS